MQQKIIDRLDARGGKGKWRARCPHHGSTGLTLSIKDAGNGRTLIHCHAGCEAADVMHAIDMRVSDLYPEDSEYVRPSISRERRELYEWVIDLAENDRSAGRRLSAQDKALVIEAHTKLREV